VAVAVATYLLDLATKVWAVNELADQPIHVINDLLVFDLVRNPGAAFSTGTSYTIVLTLIAIAAVATVIVLSRRLQSRVWAFGLGCLLGGVLGNLTDRIFREPEVFRGHVVDFIRLPHWPVFNVADMCINVAAAIIIIQALRGVSLSGKREGAEEGG
jgi:signal peptidase II